MYDDPHFEGPGEHDAHLLDDDGDDTTSCPSCGCQVWAFAESCPQCGVIFRGEAWEKKIAGEPDRGQGWSRSRFRGRLYWCGAVLLLLALIYLWVLR